LVKNLQWFLSPCEKNEEKYYCHFIDVETEIQRNEVTEPSAEEVQFKM
jgi:hypothetical protein